MATWINKYEPKTLDEIIGHKYKIKQIDNWFKDFKKPGSKRLLLLNGPPGIGKTCISKLSLEKYGYVPVEFNSGHMRSGKNIKETIDQMINNRSILDMFKQGKAPSGIIMDELDTLCSASDKGGMKELISIIKGSKTKEGYNITTPIICTYNSFSDKKLTELKVHAVEIKLSRLSDYEMQQLLEKIAKAEQIDIDSTTYKPIIKHATGDMRRLINILYDIKINYCEKEIDYEMVTKLMETLHKKRIDIQIFAATYNVFNNKCDYSELKNYYETDQLLLPMLIHENYPDAIHHRKGTLEEKLNTIIKCSEALKENDILQTSIYEKQLWNYYEFGGATLCMTVNIYLNELEKPMSHRDNIKYTTLLNKLSTFYTNKKLYNSLAEKFNTDLSKEEIFFLSENVVFHLYDKLGDKKKLVEILKDYNLSIDDIDILLRVNKQGDDDIKKKYTSKLKKELKAIIQD